LKEVSALPKIRFHAVLVLGGMDRLHVIPNDTAIIDKRHLPYFMEHGESTFILFGRLKFTIILLFRLEEREDE
jgi:hypothetical protein